MDCSTLTEPANGQVSHTAGTTFGETATYSCDTGYNLVGDNTRTCGATGVWSGCAPTCQGMLLLEMEYYLTMSIMLVIRWSETGKKWLVHIVSHVKIAPEAEKKDLGTWLLQHLHISCCIPPFHMCKVPW